MSIMTGLGVLLPDLAQHETRTASMRDYPGLPDGDYTFSELYCADKGCDCRRVTFHVFCPQLSPRVPVATLSYGWELLAFYTRWSRGAPGLAQGMVGVSIDPLGPQSDHSDAIALLLKAMLGDRDYVERLKRHYRAFKEAAAARADLPASFPRGRFSRSEAKGRAFRFRITLRDVAPPIWRLIEVPASYSFWDLHVAIQDAMGWEHEHLHGFSIPGTNPAVMPSIGVPADRSHPGEQPTLSSQQLPLIRVFGAPGDRMLYAYDFGDGWEHDVVLEEVVPARLLRAKPRLLDGARACPPEDCGGILGYQALVEAMGKPRGREYRELMDWLGEPFDPERFDKAAVRFSDPKRRG